MNWKEKLKIKKRKPTKKEFKLLGMMWILVLLMCSLPYVGEKLNMTVIRSNGYMPVTSMAVGHFNSENDFSTVSSVTGDEFIQIGIKNTSTEIKTVVYGLSNRSTKDGWLGDLFWLKNNQGKYQYFSIGDAMQGFIIVAIMNGYWRY